MDEHHGFWFLLTDPAHWQFEVVTTIVFDLITFLLLVPLWRAWRSHHRHDDQKLIELENRLSKIEKND